MDLYLHGPSSDSSGVHGVCDPAWNGLSLQEMIDSDIKAEFDDVMREDSLDLQDMDLELLNDLGNLDSPFGRYEIGSELSGGCELSLSSTHHWVESGGEPLLPDLGALDPPSRSSNQNLPPGSSSYFEDLNGVNTVLVNPSSVMPLQGAKTQVTQVAQLMQTHHSASNTTQQQTQQPQRIQTVSKGLVTSRAGGSLIKIQTASTASPGNYPSIIMPIYTSGTAGSSSATGVVSGSSLQIGTHRLGKTVKVIPPLGSSSSGPITVNPQQIISRNPSLHQQILSKHSASKKKSSVNTTGISHTAASHQHPHHASLNTLGGGTTNNAGIRTPSGLNLNHANTSLGINTLEKENGFPKPAYSYSCLIALALKNSQNGSMSVSEIYKFMCEHFPYFKTAPTGWKNSVRHNLSLNKCFEKIEKPSANGTNQRKGCLWAINPAKITKMDDEVQKWSRKDPMAIKKGMLLPHTLESLERGEMVKDYSSNGTASSCSSSIESEDEEDPRTPASVSSQGSHGYDSAGSDFVDIETFTTVPDSSLPELSLQVNGGGNDGIYEELGDDRLQFGGATLQENQYFISNTSIQGNYSILTPNGVSSNGNPASTLVVQKRDGEEILGM
eukprot:TRINITY_DN1093_c1_g1_i1.p1 TRINITY_DN1093_c1_g1~~TRINITY_DN1093_c1_g1_i1.p1  ORF type:complete len:612 (-),score=219.88 TRINITY_DN1093_c1_g1_i1:1414-3249(-)